MYCISTSVSNNLVILKNKEKTNIQINIIHSLRRRPPGVVKPQEIGFNLRGAGATGAAGAAAPAALIVRGHAVATGCPFS